MRLEEEERLGGAVQERSGKSSPELSLGPRPALSMGLLSEPLLGL